MRRDSQNFPAAGLRWEVQFAEGPNRLRAVASRGADTVSDEIDLIYQTQSWGTPAELKLSQKDRKTDTVTVEAQLFDAKGVLCLDASQLVSFSLTGAGTLIDNLGTTRASREVQLSNGRAQISIVRAGSCTAQAALKGMPLASLSL
jgi:beta-galactosidase